MGGRRDTRPSRRTADPRPRPRAAPTGGPARRGAPVRRARCRSPGARAERPPRRAVRGDGGVATPRVTDGRRDRLAWARPPRAGRTRPGGPVGRGARPARTIGRRGAVGRAGRRVGVGRGASSERVDAPRGRPAEAMPGRPASAGDGGGRRVRRPASARDGGGRRARRPAFARGGGGHRVRRPGRGTTAGVAPGLRPMGPGCPGWVAPEHRPTAPWRMPRPARRRPGP